MRSERTRDVIEAGETSPPDDQTLLVEIIQQRSPMIMNDRELEGAALAAAGRRLLSFSGSRA